jgi:hypothetical protein
MKPAEGLSPNWLDASVDAVVQSLTADVMKYDEARLTWAELVAKVKDTVETTIIRTYDHGFEHGLDAQIDEDDDDTQLELDLDQLREIGEGDEVDEEE